LREMVRHGGDLNEARKLFPDAPEPWIDLSTGINPVPYPVPELPGSAFQRLPSPGDVAALEAVAAKTYGAVEPASIAAGPGTQALIERLPYLRSRSRVAVVGPTYAEHALAWQKAGHEVAEVPEPVQDADVAVVVNPNNPDGRVWLPGVLLDLAERLHRRGGWLVVDEAFIDLEAVPSLVSARPPSAIILRSFGKAYGLAGVRLGFAAAEPEIAQELRSRLGLWAVSGPAIAIGRQALADDAWRRRAAETRAFDARRLDAMLEPLGRIAGGTRLFRLLETRSAPALFDHLGRRGLWIRRFESLPTHLRFRPPGTEVEWERLRSAIGDFLDRGEQAARAASTE
jgi:cobalamin biosynthesis protein CobC